MSGVEGKVVVITGASSGIGEAIANPKHLSISMGATYLEDGQREKGRPNTGGLHCYNNRAGS